MTYYDEKSMMHPTSQLLENYQTGTPSWQLAVLLAVYYVSQCPSIICKNIRYSIKGFTMTSIRRPAKVRDKKWMKRGIGAILVLLILFVVNGELYPVIAGITQPVSASSSITSPPVACVDKNTASSPGRDFLEIARGTGTDKVAAYVQLAACLKDRKDCMKNSVDSERATCRPWGHFYDTIYNRWLRKYSTDDADPIQFLEIGFFKGKGFEAFSQFLPRAEIHSMEISCIEPGPIDEGKWPWGNFASKSPNYEMLRNAKRLHCGDVNDDDFLHKIWSTEMKRPNAPPLTVVVDDGSHRSHHMSTSLFFWFPRIEPGGILVVEDMQPISTANKFRTHILPQVMKDLHWCGNPNFKDTRCFPTIQPLLAGVHCEMHICVFVRNDEASIEFDKEASMTPKDAFTNAQKCLFGPHE